MPRDKIALEKTNFLSKFNAGTIKRVPDVSIVNNLRVTITNDEGYSRRALFGYLMELYKSEGYETLI